MNDTEILARTLYGEAEVNDIEDAQAIACVVMNRVKLPNWPDTVRGVCLQNLQFSCWNAGSYRDRIVAADPERDKWLKECFRIAGEALAGRLADITNRSTHYYATYIKPPRWARGKTPVFSTPAGRYEHVFFNDIDTPPPQTARDALDQQRPLNESRTVKGGKAAAAGLGLQGVAEAAQHLAPAGGLLRDIAEAAPWVALAIVAAGVGYMIWARLDDRRAGVR